MFRYKKLIEIIGIFLAFIVLTFFFNTLSSGFQNNSDNAVQLIEAKEVLNGNWLLHGWTLPQDSFITTEMPFYVIGIVALGFSPNLMHNVPAVVYAILVLVSAFLASQGFESHRKWMVRIIVAVGLVMVGTWNMAFLLKGTYHAITLLMITCSLLLIMRKKWGEIISYVIMIASIIGDPLALLMGPIPILLTITYNRIQKITTGNYFQHRLFVKIVLVISVGVGLHFLLPFLGSYNYDQWLIVLPTFTEFIRNIHLLIQGIPTLYGANFVGHSIDLVGIGYFVRIIPLLYLGYVIWKWLTKKQSFTFLDSVLIFAMPIIIIGFVLFPIAHFAPDIRYLSMIFTYGIILMGRHIAKTSWTKRSILIKGAIVALIISTWIPSIELNPIADINYVTLGNWLLAHHLYSGYGSYWDTHIITIYSQENVTIAPVVAGGLNGTLSRFPHLSNIEWYENPQQPARTFLVYDDSNWGSVNKDTAVKTWGKPSSIEKVNDFTILIWDHPIIPNPIAFHKL